MDQIHSDPSENHSHSSPDDTIDIAIIGGGIAGLCLAIGILNQAPRSIRLQIFEAAAQFSEIGAGVAFGPNALRALWKLDPRLVDAYAALRTSNVYFDNDEAHGDVSIQDLRKEEPYLGVFMGMDHKTDPTFNAGKEVCEVFCEGGISSVHRARFLDALVGLLPDNFRRDCVLFGARLVSIQDMRTSTSSSPSSSGVKLQFANGQTAFADAVIGCDGVRSQVRQILLGSDSPAAQAAFSGKYAYRGLIPMEDAIAALGQRSALSGQHRIGYNGHVLTFPIDKGNTMNVVAFRTKLDGEWSGSNWIEAATKEDMHLDFADWGADVHHIIDLMQRFDKWALFDHPPASTYHRAGRICLLGDAAHASTPHHGAGAGFAVEDAYILSGLLSSIRTKRDLEAVFEIYEDSRIERTQRLVSSSREQGRIYEFQGESIGDDVPTIAAVVPRRWDWIWKHDVEDELLNAREILGQKTRS